MEASEWKGEAAEMCVEKKRNEGREDKAMKKKDEIQPKTKSTSCIQVYDSNYRHEYVTVIQDVRRTRPNTLVLAFLAFQMPLLGPCRRVNVVPAINTFHLNTGATCCFCNVSLGFVLSPEVPSTSWTGPGLGVLVYDRFEEILGLVLRFRRI